MHCRSPERPAAASVISQCGQLLAAPLPVTVPARSARPDAWPHSRIQRYFARKKRPHPFAGLTSKPRELLEGKVGDSVGHCGAEYSCPPGRASVVAAFIHRFAADRVVREERGRAMPSRPRFKGCRALFCRRTLLRLQKHSSFHHRKQVVLQRHSAGLRLPQEPRLNFRLQFQGNGHRFLYFQYSNFTTAPTISELFALSRLPNSLLHSPKGDALDIVSLFFQFRVSSFEFLLSSF